ncbi:aminoacyl-tRNA hydrolase [Patescibacteria group bacterium]|nr:aminoacyl-tRNA hydrolase [Patescibacteria group bacterium]MBU1931373.1 aminoacyl-tRNA hydrolase [Patescibacteria group bacterium]
MKHIIGLGNPGRKYQRNRHNVGFMVVDHLVGQEQWQTSKKGKLQYIWITINNEPVELVRPQAFMNRSGLAVDYIKKKHPKLNSADIFVVHDDLDIKLGEYKIQFGRGPKDHHGIASIEQHLKTNQFWRVRVGIDNRPHFAKATRGKGEEKIDGESYVLQNFNKTEQERLALVIHQITLDLNQQVLK